MSLDENEAFVRRAIEAFNARDVARSISTVRTSAGNSSTSTPCLG